MCLYWRYLSTGNVTECSYKPSGKGVILCLECPLCPHTTPDQQRTPVVETCVLRGRSLAALMDSLSEMCKGGALLHHISSRLLNQAGKAWNGVRSFSSAKDFFFKTQGVHGLFVWKVSFRDSSQEGAAPNLHFPGIILSTSLPWPCVLDHSGLFVLIYFLLLCKISEARTL